MNEIVAGLLELLIILIILGIILGVAVFVFWVLFTIGGLL